jgi:hypothetical protein
MVAVAASLNPCESILLGLGGSRCSEFNITNSDGGNKGDKNVVAVRSRRMSAYKPAVSMNAPYE